MRGGFTFRSTIIVFAAGMAMTNHGVANHQLCVWRNRQKPVFQSTAIKAQRMILAAVHGNKLVHDAAARADELIFRLLTKQGDSSATKGLTRNLQECLAHRDLERRRGTETRAEWNITVDEQIRAGHGTADALELANYTDDVVTPMSSGRSGKIV